MMIALTALALAGVSGLAGCAAVDAALYKYETRTAVDAADLDLDLPWLPADATDITLRTSVSEDAPDAVIVFDGEAPLDPEACADVPRRSAPTWSLDDSIDVYALDEVVTCGDWSATPTAEGWLAWTPNAEGERADARSILAAE